MVPSRILERHPIWIGKDESGQYLAVARIGRTGPNAQWAVWVYDSEDWTTVRSMVDRIGQTTVLQAFDIYENYAVEDLEWTGTEWVDASR